VCVVVGSNFDVVVPRWVVVDLSGEEYAGVKVSDDRLSRSLSLQQQQRVAHWPGCGFGKRRAHDLFRHLGPVRPIGASIIRIVVTRTPLCFWGGSESRAAAPHGRRTGRV